MTAKADTGGIDFEALKSFFTTTLEEQMAPLRETVKELQAKVEATDKMIPKFVPMQNRKNPSGMPKTPAEHVAAMANLKTGETHSDAARSIQVTQNGKRMDQGALAALLESYQPQFAIGDAVRINPDAERLGWAAGRTWGDLLAKEPTNPDGYGVIREIAPFSHRGWMFRVLVKGHTPERGMIFDQHELLHA